MHVLFIYGLCLRYVISVYLSRTIGFQIFGISLPARIDYFQRDKIRHEFPNKIILSYLYVILFCEKWEKCEGETIKCDFSPN